MEPPGREGDSFLQFRFAFVFISLQDIYRFLKIWLVISHHPHAPHIDGDLRDVINFNQEELVLVSFSS